MSSMTLEDGTTWERTHAIDDVFDASVLWVRSAWGGRIEWRVETLEELNGRLTSIFASDECGVLRGELCATVEGATAILGHGFESAAIIPLVEALESWVPIDRAELFAVLALHGHISKVGE